MTYEQVCETPANVEHIIVPAHDYTVETQAYYARSASEADETKKRLEAETGREWKVFSR